MALEWAQAAATARVLHVFDRACDLLTPAGEVISLALPKVGNGPFAIVVAPVADASQSFSFQHYVAAADQAHADGQALRLGRLMVAFDGCAVWSPRPGWETVSLNYLSTALPALGAWLAEAAPVGSLAPLAFPGSASLVPARYESAWSRLAQGLQSGQRAMIIEAAAQLAGAGPGVTPAGDDFLCGVLFALWLCRPDEAGAMGNVICQTAAPRTTRLSAAWLRAAARGEAAEAWHHLIAALSGQDQEAARRAVQRLARTGHTSGADALGGFLAGLGWFL